MHMCALAMPQPSRLPEPASTSSINQKRPRPVRVDSSDDSSSDGVGAEEAPSSSASSVIEEAPQPK